MINWFYYSKRRGEDIEDFLCDCPDLDSAIRKFSRLGIELPPIDEIKAIIDKRNSEFEKSRIEYEQKLEQLKKQSVIEKKKIQLEREKKSRAKRKKREKEELYNDIVEDSSLVENYNKNKTKKRRSKKSNQTKE